MTLRVLCPTCGEWQDDGLLDYENHVRAHEASGGVGRARARSCLGCEQGPAHRHNNAEDPPRERCCTHTCKEGD